MKKQLLSFLCLLTATSGFAQHLIVEEINGKRHQIDIDAETSFDKVIEAIYQHLEPKRHLGLTSNYDPILSTPAIELEFKTTQNSVLIRAAQSPKRQTPRDFYQYISDQEKHDLYYLLNVLANDSLIKINNSKNALKRVANRLDHLHPMQILTASINDPTLLSFLHKIRKRSFLWGDLADMFTNALNQEHSFNNILPHADEFANSIGLDPLYILPALHETDWEEFFAILFATHPVSPFK